MKKSKITPDKIREVLDYNPESGEFRWKKRLSQGTQAGERAGGFNVMGYWQIGILAERHYGHRLAWLHFYGEWPGGEVDHRNGVRSDNRIDNLRILTHAKNAQNVTNIAKKSKTGVLGVHLDKKKFSSKIMIDRKSIHLGSFNTIEEAHAAYLAAKRKLHEGNTL
jgi:hypothetical protein